VTFNTNGTRRPIGLKPAVPSMPWLYSLSLNSYFLPRDATHSAAMLSQDHKMCVRPSHAGIVPTRLQHVIKPF